MTSASKREQVVVLSSIDWGATRQRHQIFAAQLAAAGHEVFFVNNTGFRNPEFGDLPRVWKRIIGLAARSARSATNTIPRGLHVFSPKVLPPTSPIFRGLNSSLFLPNLLGQFRAAGLGPRPAVIACFATATTLALIDALHPSAVIYDCASNFRGHPSAPADFRRQEAALLRRSDAVVCDSDFLYEQKKAEHPCVYQIHQGVPEESFRTALAREHTHRREFERFQDVMAEASRRQARRASEPGLDLVVLSPVPWPRAPQARRDEVADWAATGRHVFFVELGGSRGLMHRLRRALFGPNPDESAALPTGVELVPALFLSASNRLGREANAALLAPRLVDLLHDRGLGASFAAALNGHSPHAGALLEKLKPALTLHAGSDSSDSKSLLTQARAAHARPAPPAPADTRRLPAFLSGLGWIGVLYGLAKASIVLTQIVAGRVLGPEEYGRANLVLAAAAYLQIAPMLGFPTAMGKFLASETEEAPRARFISTALIAFAGWTVLCLPVMAFAHRALARALDLPTALYVPSLFLATANAVYVVVASPLLGLKRFAHRGLVETVYGLAAPLALIAAVLIIGPTCEAMISALGAGFVLGAGYALWCQRRYLVLAFEPEVLRSVWRYATVATLNLLAVAFVLAPARFILHARRSPEEVGLFSAYFMATIQVALAFLYMLSSVIVPMASDPHGQRETWALVKRRAPVVLLGAWVFFIAGLLAALAVFGRRYPLRWDWVFAFSLAAALALAHGTLSALYSARDFSGLRISVIGGLLAGLANTALAIELIPAHGVSGAAAALIVSFALGLTFFLAVHRFEGTRV